MARKTSNTGVKISKSTKRVAADMLADATAATTTSAKRFSSIPAVAATKPAVATVVAAIPAAAIAAATPVATEKPACTEKSATAENTACTEKAACSEKTAANPQALHDLFNVDADVARDAAATLGSTHDSAAVDALIEVVSNTNGYFHSVVRSAAAASLAKLGDTRAVSALLIAVRDEMAEASAEAVRALAILNDAAAIPTLIEVVRNTNEFYLPVVRLAAVHALAKFKQEEAKAALAEVVANEFDDAVIRQAAADAK